jgi:hypothetical protein
MYYEMVRKVNGAVTSGGAINVTLNYNNIGMKGRNKRILAETEQETTEQENN